MSTSSTARARTGASRHDSVLVHFYPTHIHRHKHRHTHKRTQTHAHTRTQTHTHTHTHAHISSIHTHTHPHTHTHTYTHTHTHTTVRAKRFYGVLQYTGRNQISTACFPAALLLCLFLFWFTLWLACVGKACFVGITAFQVKMHQPSTCALF